MSMHELKIWPEYFLPVIEGRKTFEVRREDDRTFAVGDTLVLREWKPDLGVSGLDGWDALQYAKDPHHPEVQHIAKHLDARGYTGRSVTVTVTYILRDTTWLQPGVAALGFQAHSAGGEKGE